MHYCRTVVAMARGTGGRFFPMKADASRQERKQNIKMDIGYVLY